jgi:hypothetical protein
MEVTMDTVREVVSKLELGQPQTHLNLTFFPLISAGQGEGVLEYLVLGKALEAGLARVREVSRGGSVPELLLVNKADLPVLVLDGEELVGAKQNRIANLTVMAPPKAKTVIPVSCVEAGRWSHTTSEFAVADRACFALARAAKARHVSASLRDCGNRLSDQGGVWADIAAKAERLDCLSPTQAMSEVFERHRGRIDSYVSAFSTTDEQHGALFAIDGRIAGLDLFDRADTLSALFAKLVRSYAADAFETADQSPLSADPKAARAFVDRLATATAERYPAVGLGTDIRITSDGVSAGGLVVDDSLVHLAAFADTEPDASSAGSRGFASFGARRWTRCGI